MSDEWKPFTCPRCRQGFDRESWAEAHFEVNSADETTESPVHSQCCVSCNQLDVEAAV